MKLAYIAGKLNDDAVGYLKNVHEMIIQANLVRQMGYAVVVPCLDFVNGIVVGDLEYQDYLGNNLEILKRCDVIFMLRSWKRSKGAKKEYELAKKMKKEIRFL